MPVDTTDAALHAAFVSVRGAGGPLGAGVLVSENTVLTCAHVVNSALARDRFEQECPGPAQGVRLRLPHLDPHRELTARVDRGLWSPPRAGAAGVAPVTPGTLPYHGDLAVLRLTEEVPQGAAPAPFLLHGYGEETVALWSSGNPLAAVRATPRSARGPWVALDVLGGGTVTEGYSGGPLWDRARQAVVGLVAAVHRTAAGRAAESAATMYAISLSAIESELPTLRPFAVPVARHGMQRLLAALERVLPGPTEVMECERLLAARLGRASAGPAADLERLVGLASGTRRGVPELLDVVRGRSPRRSDGTDREDFERLRRAARAVRPGELLTLAQRRALSGLLAQCQRTAGQDLLADVLPYAPDLPTVPSLADAVDVLEGYEPPLEQPVPPLLQGVVRVSLAERPAGDYPADDLDAWIERVAGRLGVSTSATRQFRADLGGLTGGRDSAGASRAAAGGGARPGRPKVVTPPAPVPRVQVELLPTATGQRFTYQIWVWDGESAHRLVLARDSEVGSDHVVDDIRQVLRAEIREDPETALVEFFLSPAWLGLAVDTWESRHSDEDGVFVPGITRRLVIRTTGRTRESYAGWKRRTAALSHARSVVLDHGYVDPRVARAKLELLPDVSTVVVCCEPRHHGTLLRQCVQAGVHTVLWHRTEHGADVASDLLDLVEGTEPGDIPEAVRLERAKAMAEPECVTHRGRQLSLLHDAPDHRPPPLAPEAWVLAEP